MSTATKLSSPDGSNDCKFANELKFKGTCGPDTHDVSINHAGLYDFKLTTTRLDVKIFFVRSCSHISR